MTAILGAEWLKLPETRAVMEALEAAGGADCARFVGGCVRNSLMGQSVDDIDIATRLQPSATMAALKARGLRAIPTGVDHGTVTAVAGGRPFEITTLRRDVETDGRRAVVAFTEDWAEDAARRDFRLNALYAGAAGCVFDPTGGGLSDAAQGRIIFVGDPEARIREDYLRILRFFRFFAWYGTGAPDAAGLAACERLSAGVERLSAERMSKELLKLLSACDPTPAVLIRNGAFYNDTGGAWVFVVTPDGSRAVKRNVRLGRRNADTIEVLDGLSPGERVITSPYTGFADKDALDLTKGKDI